MRTLIKKYIAIKFHIICNSRNVYFPCRLLLNVKMSKKDEMAEILPENVDKAGVNNAPRVNGKQEFVILYLTRNTQLICGKD